MADEISPDAAAFALRQGPSPGIMQRMMGALFGNSPPPQAAIPPAPPLTDYPSHEDAANAQKYGFGYGRGLEPYVNNDVARVLGRNTSYSQPGSKQQLATFTPGSGVGMLTSTASNLSDATSKNLDLTNPSNADIKSKMQDVYARAALTANRIPIAALGFDPSQMVADTKIGQANIGGLYSPSSDSIYFNANNPDKLSYVSTPVHESIHRGIEKLRKNPEAAKILNELPSEELIVRHLLTTQAGNPERDAGDLGQKERANADLYFNTGYRAQGWRTQLDRLNRIAQDMIAARRPRGPI